MRPQNTVSAILIVRVQVAFVLERQFEVIDFKHQVENAYLFSKLIYGWKVQLEMKPSRTLWFQELINSRRALFNRFICKRVPTLHIYRYVCVFHIRVWQHFARLKKKICWQKNLHFSFGVICSNIKKYLRKLFVSHVIIQWIIFLWFIKLCDACSN